MHSLKESLANSEDSNKIDSLRTELEISNSEVERLHRAIQDLEEWKGKAEDDSMWHVVYRWITVCKKYSYVVWQSMIIMTKMPQVTNTLANGWDKLCCLKVRLASYVTPRLLIWMETLAEVHATLIHVISGFVDFLAWLFCGNIKTFCWPKWNLTF